jgi:hypothetical protein
MLTCVSQGAHIILGGDQRREMVDKYERLFEKVRRRHREETARKTDEDAASTDTMRVRDLRSLGPAEGVRIDQTRQVLAKDCFSLDLSHSNGQRLECQVELIFRDKPSDPKDCDILIRETGSAGRSWLLFPPLLVHQVSARRGEGSRSLVAMVRGVHDGDEWYQLLGLVADHEDTAKDWLDLLGKSPVPPAASSSALTITRHTAPSPNAIETDVPVGERKDVQPSGPLSPHRDSFSPSSPHGAPPPRTTPSRYQHQRNKSLPGSPSPGQQHAAASRSPSYGHARAQSVSPQGLGHHPLPRPPVELPSRTRQDVAPEPSKLAKTPPSSAPFREDGAPPPPAHRTLTPKRPPKLTPQPVEIPPPSRVRRRTSSPLKHEYHPSDVSSDESSSTEGSESESESSADELDEDDVPDALPAISIKKPEIPSAESAVSECSLTPSNSASQAGLHRPPAPEYTHKFVATVSYWNDKRGTWKELVEQASTIVVTPGLIEAYPLDAVYTYAELQSSGSSEAGGGRPDVDAGAARPLIALDLTPLVMIRQSTVIDLEVRSPVRSYAKYNRLDKSLFRFRANSRQDSDSLYAAVHRSRMNNAKFKALEEEARFRSFGQGQPESQDAGAGDDTSSRRRRSWFGRKNSYRASTRAPSQSQGSASSGGVSASSFLKRLTGGGGGSSFNIDRSSVDKQSRGGTSSGATSLYTSGSSSASPLRSPSISLAESSGRGVAAGLGTENLRVRCHLQVSPSKWEDHGNCLLSIARPPPGVRQELRLYHGMEKRVVVTTVPRKKDEAPLVVLDVVVGSGCFTRLAARGIILNVWEDLRDERNRVGIVPREGGLSGKVKKWCFQCGSAAEANWIHGLVAQEVMIA